MWLPALQVLCFIVVANCRTWPSWPRDFRWSSAGKKVPYNCLKIHESAEPKKTTWNDNYFCSRNYRKKIGWKWSSAGRIDGMKCTQIREPADKHTWNDNYLCLPKDAPYNFVWSSAGAKAGLSCIRWVESSDPATWDDNFLCARPNYDLPDPVFPRDFRWSYAGVPNGYDCIRVKESADKKYWHDNYLCWRHGRKNPGIKWSSAGKIGGMRCTQIREPSEPKKHTWNDNYLCVPRSSKLRFEWHYAGAPADYSCIQWKEPSKKGYWKDNYLCAEKCKLTKIQIMDQNALDGRYEGTQVIGVATGGHCIGSAEHTLKIDHMDSVEESAGIELSETNEINWGVSTSVSVEASAKFLGSGGSVTMGVQLSVGGAYSYSTTNTKEFTQGTSSGLGHETTYSSPGAAIMIGMTDRFKIDRSRTPIKMHFQCPSGANFIKDSTMKLRATTYASATFEAMVGQFNKDACKRDNSIPDCVRALPRTYRNYFGEIADLRNAFSQCFAGGKGTISK